MKPLPLSLPDAVQGCEGSSCHVEAWDGFRVMRVALSATGASGHRQSLVGGLLSGTRRDWDRSVR